MFLKDENKSYSYHDFIFAINEPALLRQKIIYKDLFPFYLSIVQSLICNLDILLLDNENNLNYDKSFEKEKTNYTFLDICKKILNSTSAISLVTSGTTGLPKIVENKIDKFIYTLKVKPERELDIWALCYNPSHIAGIQVFFQAFMNRNTIINFTQNFDKNMIINNKITNISCTPTFFKIYFQGLETIDSVKRVTFGGERVNSKLLNLAAKIFPNACIRNIYASTEAGSLLVSKGEFFEISKDDSKVKILNDEIFYWSVIERKWLGSGDLVEFLDDTKFKIIGREKELINIGGYNVFPAEIELVVLNKFDVLDVFVYDRENSITGKILCMEITLKDHVQKDDLLREIKLHLKKKLPVWKIPRIIKFINRLEASRTGKRKIV